MDDHVSGRGRFKLKAAEARAGKSRTSWRIKGEYDTLSL